MGDNSIKYSVFTLAFPGYDIKQAISISSEIGFDGLDLRVASDEHVPVDVSKKRRRELLEYVKSLSIVFSGIYSYAGRALVDFDPKIRRKEVNLIKAHVDLAVDLEATHLRIFAGTDERTEENIQRFIDSCREIGEYARKRGIIIGIESHGELAYNADSCIRLVRDIDLDNVRIIFDPANMQNIGLSPVIEGRKMRNYIAYIQVKDWILKEPVLGRVKAVPLGEGEVNLRDIINLLKETSYRGWICVEYEKKWHPELPDPKIGLLASLKYLKRAFQ